MESECLCVWGGEQRRERMNDNLQGIKQMALQRCHQNGIFMGEGEQKKNNLANK